MSSTLHFRKTPTDTKEFGSCKLPLKGIIAQRFYDHDGTLGGGMETIQRKDLEWFKGVRDCGLNDKEEQKLVEKIIEILEDGGTVDMWFDV